MGLIPGFRLTLPLSSYQHEEGANLLALQTRQQLSAFSMVSALRGV
jgi:hypothetical protein